MHFPGKYTYYLGIAKGSGIEVMDLINLLFVVLSIFIMLIRRNSKVEIFSGVKIELLLLGIFLVLLIPAIKGYLSGHSLVLILRDIRIPFSFLLAYLIGKFLVLSGGAERTFKWLERFLRYGIWYCSLVWLLNIRPLYFEALVPTTSTLFAKRIASFSVIDFSPILFFISLGKLLAKAENKKKFIWFFDILLVAFFYVLTLSRGALISFLFGLGLYYLLYMRRKKLLSSLSYKIFILVFMSLILFFLPFFFNYELTEAVRGVPILERYYSMIKPDITTKSAVASAEFRKEALTFFLKYQDMDPNYSIFIGFGYGEKIEGSIDETFKTQLAHYFGHSSIGGALFRMGIIIFSIFSIFFFILLKKIIRDFHKSTHSVGEELFFYATLATLSMHLIRGLYAATILSSMVFPYSFTAFLLGLLLMFSFNTYREG
ncbi:MAG: hypothetical protein QXF70_04465 [Candidatus Bilamarchaeaceae archaeon]